ncbi:histone acetyltransferase [Batrachochytrium dendrobatidis]|nr:histone acetyltransferase [Batrachochytrium dendrobatidis]
MNDNDPSTIRLVQMCAAPTNPDIIKLEHNDTDVIQPANAMVVDEKTVYPVLPPSSHSAKTITKTSGKVARTTIATWESTAKNDIQDEDTESATYALKNGKLPAKGQSSTASIEDVEMEDAEHTTEAMTIDLLPPQIASDLVAEKLKNNKALQTEREGLVSFRVVKNDGTDESMILLTGLKNIYQRQLPNMPREYISRLVYDRNHHHMAVVRRPLIVLGGITYRPFDKRNFAEIVFCAITSTEQVQGYGSRLMSHVKDYVREAYDIWNFLTYADNYAVGYFKKQGFTTEITLEKRLWVGYIKDYEGGTIMQCHMIKKIKYLDVVNTIVAHRWAVFKKIKEASKSSIVYPGIKDFSQEVEHIDPMFIPGLKEAGWTPGLVSTRPPPRERSMLHIFMKKMVVELKEDDNSWPFLEPVAGVPDYYDIIKEPMDLGTLEKNVDNDKYTRSDQFFKDVLLIFSNCRIYNEDSSPYARCAVRVEKWFRDRFKHLKAEMRIE